LAASRRVGALVAGSEVSEAGCDGAASGDGSFWTSFSCSVTGCGFGTG
jgi:hypothetical protein